METIKPYNLKSLEPALSVLNLIVIAATFGVLISWYNEVIEINHSLLQLKQKVDSTINLKTKITISEFADSALTIHSVPEKKKAKRPRKHTANYDFLRGDGFTLLPGESMMFSYQFNYDSVMRANGYRYDSLSFEYVPIKPVTDSL